VLVCELEDLFRVCQIEVIEAEVHLVWLLDRNFVRGADQGGR
jgi:hypothetical protein